MTLKEGRPLVLVVREAPLHAGHLELMRKAARLGAIIYPPVPAFYARPQTWKRWPIRLSAGCWSASASQTDLVARWEG